MRQLRPGDEILEVNAARIGVDLKGPGVLRAALADTKYVHLLAKFRMRLTANIDLSVQSFYILRFLHFAGHFQKSSRQI